MKYKIKSSKGPITETNSLAEACNECLASKEDPLATIQWSRNGHTFEEFCDDFLKIENKREPVKIS